MGLYQMRNVVLSITLQNLTPYRLQFFEIDFQGGANFSLAVMNS